MTEVSLECFRPEEYVVVSYITGTGFSSQMNLQSRVEGSRIYQFD